MSLRQTLLSVRAINASTTPSMLTYSTVSAGFDAAAGDPLGMCNVTPTGYAHMTYMLSSLAGGKCCVVLEARLAPSYVPLH